MTWKYQSYIEILRVAILLDGVSLQSFLVALFFFLNCSPRYSKLIFGSNRGLQDFNTKVSGFGLARDGPTSDRTHVSTRVMGTYGYAAPEYLRTGSCFPTSCPFAN